MDRPEAETSEAFIVILQPGKSPHLHVHHDTDQGYYVLRGAGTLQIDADSPQYHPIKPRYLVRIPPHTIHLVRRDGPEQLGYLVIDCFLRRRPKDEPMWESWAPTICAQNGWDLYEVRTR